MWEKIEKMKDSFDLPLVVILKPHACEIQFMHTQLKQEWPQGHMGQLKASSGITLSEEKKNMNVSIKTSLF